MRHTLTTAFYFANQLAKQRATIPCLLLSLALLNSSNGFSQWVPEGYGVFGAQLLSVANSGGNIVSGSTSSGIHFSVDGGLTWKRAAIAQPPGVVNWLTTGATRMFAASSTGVFISDDNGATWQASGLQGIYIRQLVVHGSMVVAVGSGVFLSGDNGLTWTEALTVNETGGTVNAMTAAGTDLFMTGSSHKVLKSTDNGQTWTEAGDLGTYAYSMTAIGTQLFAGTSEGLFTSPDGASSWTKVSTPLAPLYDDFTAVLAVGGDLFAGTTADFMKSQDGGLTWTLSNAAFGGYVTQFAQYGPDLLASVSGSGVYRSTDDGATWSRISGGPLLPIPGKLVARDQTIIAGAFQGIFRSTDSGSTWGAVSGGPTLLVTGLAALSANKFVAATNDEGVFVSSDNGATWSASNTGLPSLNASGVQYVGGVLYAGTASGLGRSYDEGASWGPTGLSGFRVSTVVEHLGALYACSNLGIMRSFDQGDSWTNISFDLPDASAFTILVSWQGQLYGSSSSGVRVYSGGNSWSVLAPTQSFNVMAMTADPSALYIATNERTYAFSGGSLVPLAAPVLFNYQEPRAILSHQGRLYGAFSYGNSGTIWSIPLTMLPLPASFSPQKGTVGTIVTITGTNFGATPTLNKVKFNGYEGTVLQASPTSLQVAVPNVGGKPTVSVMANGITANFLSTFTTVPEIASVTPLEAPVGAMLTVRGRGFDAKSSAISKFGEGVSSELPSDASTLRIFVPVGAQSGPIVTTFGSEIVVTPGFAVIPEIHSFSPAEGKPGTQVFISGTGFSNISMDNTLKFNGVPATIVTSNVVQMATVVPPNATSGRLSITVAGKVAFSGGLFSVLPLPVSCPTPPPQPIITIHHPPDSPYPLLRSSSPAGNQWYLFLAPIVGATGRELSVQSTGPYLVEASVDGCPSPMSAVQEMVITGDAPAKGDLIAYPNPFDDSLLIDPGAIAKDATVCLYSMVGTMVYREVIPWDRTTRIDTSTLPAGVYILVVLHEGRTIVKRLVK